MGFAVVAMSYGDQQITKAKEQERNEAIMEQLKPQIVIDLSMKERIFKKAGDLQMKSSKALFDNQETADINSGSTGKAKIVPIVTKMALHEILHYPKLAGKIDII